jgi:hypothetical protein
MTQKGQDPVVYIRTLAMDFGLIQKGQGSQKPTRLCASIVLLAHDAYPQLLGGENMPTRQLNIKPYGQRLNGPASKED